MKPLPRPVPADFLAFDGSGAFYAARLRRAELIKQFEEPTRFWQLEPRRRELSFPTFERLEGIAYANEGQLATFSPDGRLVAVLWRRWVKNGNSAFSVGEQVDLWDLAGPRHHLILFKNWSKVTLHPDGSSSWSGRGGGLSPFGQNPRQLAFSSDSRKLAIAYSTGAVIYNVADGRPVRWLGNAEHPKPGFTRYIPTHSVAFSPDGRWVVYGGGEGLLNIGSVDPTPEEPPVLFARTPGDHSPEVAERKPRIVWKGHDGTVLALAVSPDGRTLASGGQDRMIRLWELPTGRPLARWEAQDADVTALAFRPDGRTLNSGAADGMLKLWDLNSIHRELAALGLDW